MADWRYVFLIAPTGDATCTVLKGNRLPAPLLFDLGNKGFSIEVGKALSDADVHSYERLHSYARSSPLFGWFPDISSGPEP